MTDKPHIFVVDDEAAAREMVGDYLAMHDFNVTLCDGGAGLREALRSATPDLVVLDLNMPDEDGLSVIRFLKQACPCPVIMLTATASAIDRVVGLEIGADDYLAKPCELRELLARIRSILRRVHGTPGRPAERRLAAIVAFDFVEFSRFVQVDEHGTLAALDMLFTNVVKPRVLRHKGTLFKMTGDGGLIEFPSVVDAAEWALAFQEAVTDTHLVQLAAGTMRFRVGVAVGDIVVAQADRLGEGVVLAVRVQEVAAPGGIALTDHARDLLRGKSTVQLHDSGERYLKNVLSPVRIWSWPEPLPA